MEIFPWLCSTLICYSGKYSYNFLRIFSMSYYHMLFSASSCNFVIPRTLLVGASYNISNSVQDTRLPPPKGRVQQGFLPLIFLGMGSS
jgi:hypothetical protein